MIDITSVAPIPFVVQQHAEETAMLRLARSFLVRSSEIGLDAMARHDRRIAAHLDGLQVAGSCGLQLCMQALERTGAGEVFAASACAIQLGDERTLADLIEQLGAEPEAMRRYALVDQDRGR